MKSVEAAIGDAPGRRPGVGDVLAGQGPAADAASSRPGCSTSATTPCPTCRPASSRGPSTSRASPAGSATTGSTRCSSIAGDAATPLGPYDEGAVVPPRPARCRPTGCSRVGVTAYPDGHPLIDAPCCARRCTPSRRCSPRPASAGRRRRRCASTPPRIRDWLASERARGLTLPVDLGIPGVVDRTTLMTMGVRLGVGASLRYLRKNRATMVRAAGARRLRPDRMLGRRVARPTSASAASTRSRSTASPTRRLAGGDWGETAVRRHALEAGSRLRLVAGASLDGVDLDTRWTMTATPSSSGPA